MRSLSLKYLAAPIVGLALLLSPQVATAAPISLASQPSHVVKPLAKYVDTNGGEASDQGGNAIGSLTFNDAHNYYATWNIWDEKANGHGPWLFVYHEDSRLGVDHLILDLAYHCTTGSGPCQSQYSDGQVTSPGKLTDVWFKVCDGGSQSSPTYCGGYVHTGNPYVP